MNLYVIKHDIAPQCLVKGVNHLEAWYAAYVKIAPGCDIASIVKSLQDDGADFLLIESNGQEDYKINVKSLRIPVFFLNSNKHSQIIELVSELDSKQDPKNTDPKPISKMTITFAYKKVEGKNPAVKFYYSPASVRSFDFIQELAVVFDKMQAYMTFEPITVIYKLVTASSQKNKNCYLQTAYCAPDPDGDGAATGEDVVRESLYQKCVFTKSANKWFSYMTEFNAACRPKFEQKCTENTVSGAGLDLGDVKSCVEKSHIGNKENSILQAEVAALHKLHEMNYPILTVNDVIYYGPINDKAAIGRAICESMTSPPENCGSFSAIATVYHEEQKSLLYSLLAYFYVLIIAMLVTALACMWIARRAARKEVSDEVRRSVAHYFNMREIESLQS